VRITLGREEGGESEREVIRMVSRAFAALLIVLAVGAVPIAASASPPETETTTGRDTDTFVDFAPTCAGGGPLYEITIDFNFVEHSTVSADGAHFTFTNTGTFVAVALEPGEPDASGRVHSMGWF
jgi:hypothetical protein